MIFTLFVFAFLLSSFGGLKNFLSSARYGGEAVVAECLPAALEGFIGRSGKLISIGIELRTHAQVLVLAYVVVWQQVYGAALPW